MQILTTQQAAQIVVHTYPHVGFSPVMLEAIATEQGEASKAEIEAAAVLNPMTAEWQQLTWYCDMVAAKVYPDHVPLLTPLQQSHGLLTQY